jgi:glutaredoxin 3
MQAEVFTKPGCPYCVAAKQLLVKRNIPYVERDITQRSHWDEIKARVPGFRTVPQIFLEGQHIGGFDDLTVHFQKLAAAERQARPLTAKSGLGERFGRRIIRAIGGRGTQLD